jgi:signal transduction histidine kinase
MRAKSSGDERKGRRAERIPSAASPSPGSDLALEDLIALCSHLRQSADAGKRNLARALHDSPAQTVSAALLTLFLLEREKRGLTTNAQRALRDAQALLSTCGEELRRLSHDLYPPLLDEVGLLPPLRALARKLGPTRLRLKVSEVPRLPRRVEETAFRFVEEALAEALHGRAPVEVSLHSDRGAEVVIALEGRLRAASRAQRLALIALAQRAHEAGGVFSRRDRRGRVRLAATFSVEPPGQKPSATPKPTPAPPGRTSKTKLQPLAFRGTEGQLRRGGR